ncbi:crotonase/enoyl-CoA hydratase family protein [Sphingorhabdus sp. Alg239-R122]|uniref:crotonase/enoyl-CoA hydratase family protein n=1 Tax=Sphingorhabdus sp. Alg239-R122 TaxID=2305989 RepID=UPI0013DACA25|nr:crotonase/enoyl-CoA hydratase family protein [Sphingorhabdus sp. Alg239-R122]
MTEQVLTETQDGVLIITINRPEAKNAVNRAVAEGVADAMERLDSDKGLSAGIITGAGGTFCAGMDLKAFLKGELPTVKGKGFAGFCEAPPAKPLIGAVEGYALAGGMEVAIACDMVVANDKAQFGIPEVKRSLVAAGGGLLSLPSIIGKRMAMELALTGDFITAERAYEMGFVNRVTEGAALEGALELAVRVAANGPLALIASKRIINERPDWSSAEMWAKQMEIAGKVLASQDAREGAAAFAEKRKPEWKGE